MEEIRCQCKSKRLLAQAVIDGQRPYLLVRSHKSKRLVSEVKVYVGAAEILCVSCGRSTRVSVRRTGVESQPQEELPRP